MALVDKLWLAAVAGIRDPALRMIVQILDDRTESLHRAIRRLAEKMASVEAIQEELDAVTTDLADRWEQIEQVNADLRAAVLAGDAARAQQLAEQAEAYSTVVAAGVEKLRGIGASADNPVPDTTPLPDPAPTSDTPAPDAGTPDAGTPADGTTPDFPPVDGAPPAGSTGPGDPANPGDQVPADGTPPADAPAPDTGTADPCTGTASTRRGRGR